MQIANTVALVTGAASGLGFSSAQKLAEQGAYIVALDLDLQRLEKLAGVIPADRLLTVAGSVADAAQVQAAIDAALERFGALHVAVNCAGVADAAKTVSKDKAFPLEIWEKVIGINLTGTFNVIRLAAVAMTRNAPNEDGERGVIVNTSSGAAMQGQVGQAAYSASKAGVNEFLTWGRFRRIQAPPPALPNN